MTGLFLSRIRLRRDAPVAALARLLLPDATDARVAAAHQLVWSLFADGPDRRRDFLWREEAPGRFLTLSPRAPVDATGLFTVETKPFAPALAAGDRLGFVLRANPVVSRATARGSRSRRHDVVMDALHAIPGRPRPAPDGTPEGPSERAEARPEAIVSAGRAWLTRQGEAAGFELDGALVIDGYARRRVPRLDAKDAVFGVLDFEGVLKVLDPEPFLARLASGYGRARAFGYGLMLIRRVR